MIYLTFNDSDKRYVVECPNENIFNEVAMDINSRVGFKNLRKNVKGKFDKERVILSYKEYKDKI